MDKAEWEEMRSFVVMLCERMYPGVKVYSHPSELPVTTVGGHGLKRFHVMSWKEVPATVVNQLSSDPHHIVWDHVSVGPEVHTNKDGTVTVCDSIVRIDYIAHSTEKLSDMNI